MNSPKIIHLLIFLLWLYSGTIESDKSPPEGGTALQISGTTTMLGLIGTPAAHSKSPTVYNHCFVRFGLDWDCLAFDVPSERVGDAVDTIQTRKVRGANVTMPWKNAVIPFLDELTPAARAIQTVHTIVNDNGRLLDRNTDGCGYTRNLCRDGAEVRDKRIVLPGGGAAAAICVQAALDGKSRIAPALFRPDLVADTGYNPRETRLIEEAKAAGGGITVGGIGMLLRQGVAAFQLFNLFTGKDMPVQEVLEKFS